MTTRIVTFRALAQEAAEKLHRDTGAPYAIALALCPVEAGQLTLILGAWVPSVGVLAELLRSALRSIDADPSDPAAAEITDYRKG